MRRILFRGKMKTDNGIYRKNQWVYGDFVQLVDGKRLIPHIYGAGEIIPETLGQYTALKDCNGKKIYEGDIVRLIDKFVDFRTYAVIEFGNPNGLYNWGWQLRPLENKPFAVEILHWVDMEESGAYIEVVGNIHDKPEL